MLDVAFPGSAQQSVEHQLQEAMSQLNYFFSSQDEAFDDSCVDDFVGDGGGGASTFAAPRGQPTRGARGGAAVVGAHAAC